MDNIWSSQLKTPWQAAHRHQISENDYENADIPNICEEVRGRLAGGGRGAGGVLRLGPATELLHGAALLLLDKTERTLQDTFELSQKIMLKNCQNVPECRSSDALDEESEEDGDSEVETVALFGKSSGNRTNEMSKSLKTNEVLGTGSESGDAAVEATSSDELSNVSDGNEGNGSQDSRSKEEDAIEVEERAAQEDRQCSEQSSGQGRGESSEQGGSGQGEVQCSEHGEQGSMRGRGQGSEQGEVGNGQGREQCSKQGEQGSELGEQGSGLRRGQGSGQGGGQGRGRCSRGFDPRLRLGVMLIYEDSSQNVPNKIFISSINPRTKL